MDIIWGVVMVVLAALCWGGQTVSLFAPTAAVKLTLTESEESVDPAYWADIRGEALWDFLTLWTLLVAGGLLIIDHTAWAYFGLVGGGMYVYFAGRGIVTRTEMQRRGVAIGTAANVRAAYLLLPIWGVMGLVTIVASVVALTS